MSERYKYPNDSVTRLIASRDNEMIDRNISSTRFGNDEPTLTPQAVVDNINANEIMSEVVDKRHDNTREEIKNLMQEIRLTQDEAVWLTNTVNSSPIAHSTVKKIAEYAGERAGERAGEYIARQNADTATKKHSTRGS